MTHHRKTIRDQVTSLLEAADIVASGRVYSNRVLSVAEGLLPVINVYMASELSTSLNVLKRDLTLKVDIIACDADEATLDDTLDALAEQVEFALKSDHTWSGVVITSSLIASELSIEETGERPIGHMTLTYQARYFDGRPPSTGTLTDIVFE